MIFLCKVSNKKMSVAEETIQTKMQALSKSKSAPVVNRILDFLSSVRFGVTLLCILVLFSFVGMLIIQQNVNGFDAYYASLTPAEKLVYGSLGIFDIYYSWYFKFLLIVLSLNIVLASIDRIKPAWKYISKPKLTATRGWLLRQTQNAVVKIKGDDERDIADKISRALKATGFSAGVSEA